MYDRRQHALPARGRQAVKSENRGGALHLIGLLRGVALVLLVWGGPCFAQLSSDPQALAAIGERVGLRDVPGFVETVQTLRNTGHLPSRYVTKDDFCDGRPLQHVYAGTVGPDLPTHKEVVIGRSGATKQSPSEEQGRREIASLRSQ